jgi:hypothetical protein
MAILTGVRWNLNRVLVCISYRTQIKKSPEDTETTNELKEDFNKYGNENKEIIFKKRDK